MTLFLIGISAVLLLCITFSKILYKLGVPTLLIFLALGMLAGSDGIGGFYFDDYKITEQIASIALMFIMFYGGFGTSWSAVRPVAVQAVLLSSVGTAATALLTGYFCYFALNFSLYEGLLVGAVIASTDAASVFAILRSKKMKLKHNIVPLLEVESGSNDPFSYMLTMIILSLMAGIGNPETFVPSMLFKQIVYGGGIGVILGIVAFYVMRNVYFEIEGFYLIFTVAITVLGYALSIQVGGNGFLCVYFMGIILGNGKIFHRKSLTAFFDGISWLMQIALFFVLGLLSFPSKLTTVAFEGILIALFIILIARPIGVFSILSWFKTPVKAQLFVSWVGIRGAASIVFAIYAITMANTTHINDIFHIVFFVVLFSILIQGGLLPHIAKKLKLIDETEENTIKEFADYENESYTKLMEICMHENHPWVNKTIMEAKIPDHILIIMIKRNNEIIIPNGSTLLQNKDILVITGTNMDSVKNKILNCEK